MDDQVAGVVVARFEVGMGFEKLAEDSAVKVLKY